MTDTGAIQKEAPNILMVDDTPANLELLSGMLEARGYKVRVAISGKLALQAARNSPPDLILLDINMPDMNGYEVCGILKSEDKLKDIPVIFLSALSETIDKVKAFGTGGVDYISKPFHLEEVEARIETHLKLRRQESLLQENYNKLLALEKLRDSLVHMIIHDLRSPLTGIYAHLQLLGENAQKTLSGDQLANIEQTLKTAKQMIQLVNDVLDVSKMEEQRMELKVEQCDLVSMVTESISGLKALSKTREIQFTPDKTPVTVLADRDIILRIVQNLLSNALKFTQDGGLIRLDLKSAGGRVRLSVRDNGPGIAPEYREKIFEKFAQVELPAGRQKYSTGLGLTFCRMAAEAHGGNVGVDSEEGKGSTFWLELPVNGPVRKEK
ncbi:MAG: hypothetical protein A2X28_08005 [Elusimicrobia bacterium GWA2_56_46]|nr:MAG: hypothetical protein A2X28_08005 [Elusimicrobia bacterium GWA2_56_46]OGR54300.1 MAG: hypothetical protein A2X39_03705 [Elusimicrobia bacterium GWC2_56_31]HBB66538.1 hybrid sensor histidine kinase/response regulator [Elusimicrobiota bacterium]HBW22412.1 hybrid sensor histidine kinase/response regulator [Elusimicrobiota bacterium]